MSRVFLEEMDIPTPDVNLGVGSGGHGRQTGLMLMRLEEVMLLVQNARLILTDSGGMQKEA